MQNSVSQKHSKEKFYLIIFIDNSLPYSLALYLFVCRSYKRLDIVCG